MMAYSTLQHLAAEPRLVVRPGMKTMCGHRRMRAFAPDVALKTASCCADHLFATVMQSAPFMLQQSRPAEQPRMSLRRRQRVLRSGRRVPVRREGVCAGLRAGVHGCGGLQRRPGGSGRHGDGVPERLGRPVLEQVQDDRAHRRLPASSGRE